MVVESIFELIPEVLYSVKWEDQEDHSLNEYLDKLTDAQWLYNFFKENKELIRFGPYKYLTAERWVVNTREGIEDMDLLLHEDLGDRLKYLFEDLNGESQVYELDPVKAKGAKNWGWIRIYALKNDFDQYFITGYAIKVTQKMDQHQDTKEQLKRLALAEEYLINYEEV